MRAFLLAACATLALASPCAADQILGPGRIISGTNAVVLPGGPTLGLWTSGKFTSTPGSTLIGDAVVVGSLGGLQPIVSMGANLTGSAFSANLAPPANSVGPSAQPLAGIYSNVISNNGHASTRNGNVNAYRAAILGQTTAYANSPDVFGLNIQINHDQTAPTDISVIGAEIDMAKNGSRDCNSIGGPVYCAGFLMTSSTDGKSSWGPAFLVEGVTNSFHYGYAVNGAGVKDVAFMDASNALTSLNLAGSHTTGINFSGAFSGQQIAGKGWSVDATGNLSASTLGGSQLNIGNGGSPGITYSYAGFSNAKTVALNNVVGNSENGPEFGGSFQLVSSGGSSNHFANFKVALTSVYQALPGAADGWGANFSASSTSSVASGTGLIGLEIDLNNSHYNATTDPASPYVTALYITGAGSGTANAGMIIAGSGKTYRDGIYFEDRSPSGQSIIQNATINDRSKSPNILVTNTAHTNGVDFINGTFTGFPFRSPGFSVDGAGTLNAVNMYASGSVNVTNGISAAGIQAGTVNATGKAIIAPRTVGTSSTACTAGEIAFDASYIYTCAATNSWKRVASGSSW